jgi:hypothetical protein
MVPWNRIWQQFFHPMHFDTRNLNLFKMAGINVFFRLFVNLPFYPRYVCILRVNKRCLVILWYHPRCLPHSWPHEISLWATIATHLRSKMVENAWKQVFDDTYPIMSHSTHKYVLCANKCCSIILWYHLRCLLYSWPHIVTLWPTIATHLWAKMAQNGWKQVLDNT